MASIDEIWLVDFGEPDPGEPEHVERTDETGLDATSYVQCELVRSVNRRRLVHRLGAVDLTTSRRVADVVQNLLGY
jgi:mRNA-degrading endonuclease toxin of MazEF toxin-antitoxin module